MKTAEKMIGKSSTKVSKSQSQTRRQSSSPAVNATKVKRIRKPTFRKGWDKKSNSYFWRCLICLKRLKSPNDVHWYHTKRRSSLKLFRCGKCFNKQIGIYGNKTSEKFKCNYCMTSKTPVPNFKEQQEQDASFEQIECKVELIDHSNPSELLQNKTDLDITANAEIKVEAESYSDFNDNNLSLTTNNLNCTAESISVSNLVVNERISPEISNCRSSNRIRDRVNKRKSDLALKSKSNSGSVSVSKSTSASSISIVSVRSLVDDEVNDDDANPDDDDDNFSQQPVSKRRKTSQTLTTVTNGNSSHSNGNKISVDQNIHVEPSDKTEFIHGDVGNTDPDLQGYLSVSCQQVFQDPIELQPCEQTQKFAPESPTIKVIYQCELCEKRFKTKGEHKNHQSIHFEDRPFVCEICSQRFKQMQGLRVHRFTHRSDTPFNCSSCERSFKTVAHLKSHQLTHSEEKHFICNYCGKAFKQSTTLINHEKTHLASKPYKCDQCDSSFKIKSTLDRHILTHTDERRFTCQYCVKKFKRSDALKAHERIHVCNS